MAANALETHTVEPVCNPPRKALLVAARKELAWRPATEISMQRIADRAGLSRRTLYNQFADRDRLFEALLDELLREVEAGPTINLSGNSLDEVTLSFCRQLLDSVARPAHHELLGLVAKGELPQAERLYRLRVRDPLAVMLERRLLAMALSGFPLVPGISEEINRLFELIAALSLQAQTAGQQLIAPRELATIFSGRIQRSAESGLELRKVAGL